MTKPQTKTVRRRSHSTIDALPPKLRVAIEKMLVSNEWPKDCKRHYNGIPRHCDIEAYCRSKGFRFSKSAIGRFAVRIQKASAQKITGDFRNYARSYLGVLCLAYSDIQRDLNLSIIGSDRRETLEEQQEKNIDRIEKLITDLRKLDSVYPNTNHGG